MSEFAKDYEQKTRLLAELHEAERENAALRRRLDSCMHAGDLEHARMAALLNSVADMLNVLVVLRYPDPATLWRLGGIPLENAYQALKRSAAAVRPQADAFVAELKLLRELAADVARWREAGGDPRDMAYILETMDRIDAMKARSA